MAEAGQVNGARWRELDAILYAGWQGQRFLHEGVVGGEAGGPGQVTGARARDREEDPGAILFVVEDAKKVVF